MGGRGAASGISNKGVTYGREYKTLFRVDNIKFVQSRKPGSTPVPLETMSAGRNRVYALVNNEGTLKAITFYNKQGMLKRQIDLDHWHLGRVPHVHTGYAEGRSKKYVPMTKSDNAYVEKVRKIWNNHK